MTDNDDLKPEYTAEMLGKGVRGKYYQQAQKSNLILLDPDVAAAFPDAKLVNDALRALKNIAQQASLPH
jgi:hypothetical protein